LQEFFIFVPPFVNFWGHLIFIPKPTVPSTVSGVTWGEGY
jgi:hypothetical protein